LSQSSHLSEPNHPGDSSDDLSQTNWWPGASWIRMETWRQFRIQQDWFQNRQGARLCRFNLQCLHQGSDH
jgi:hypothetical protein